MSILLYLAGLVTVRWMDGKTDVYDDVSSHQATTGELENFHTGVFVGG